MRLDTQQVPKPSPGTPWRRTASRVSAGTDYPIRCGATFARRTMPVAVGEVQQTVHCARSNRSTATVLATMHAGQVIGRAPTLPKEHRFAAGEEIVLAKSRGAGARLMRDEAPRGRSGLARQSIKSLSCRNPVGYRTMGCRDIGGH